MYKTMQHIPQDNLLHNIIPFIGYFDLGDFLVSLCYRSDKIASIKSKEYHRRLKCIDNPHKEISKIYTIDGGQHCIKNLKVIHPERSTALIWYNVILHRHDGPTVIWADGTTEWYYNNNLHRDDGPAVIDSDGNQYWYKNGYQHRDNRPASIRSDGHREWKQYNKTHREDGPAVRWATGGYDWIIHNRYIRNHKRNYKTTYILDGLTVDIYTRPDADKTAIFAYIIIPNWPSIEYYDNIYNVYIDEIHIISVKLINDPRLYCKMEIIYLDKENEKSIILTAEKTNKYYALQAYYEKINTV
jgi:hypothetical protein